MGMSNTFKTDLSHIALVLLAAGSSSRMGGTQKKEYLALSSGTVLSESAKPFLSVDFSRIFATLEHVVLVIKDTPHFESEKARAMEALFSDPFVKTALETKKLSVVAGGNTRAESVCKGLEALKDKHITAVLIHDGARAFVSPEIIFSVAEKTIHYGAAVPVIPSVDTQKQLGPDKTIHVHLDRETVVNVQTPQGFLFEPILACYQKALTIKNKSFTDDSAVWDSFPECTGAKKVYAVAGSQENKKITYPQDISAYTKESILRIGFGTDIHVLAHGRRFVLGGVEIPFNKGEVGHSDGDVLLHAIADALLGASARGDIGSYFPPSEEKWKDAQSADLLKIVWDDIKKSGWTLENLDCVIELEAPAFLPWRKTVIASIARILDVEEERIFVKAKTNEKQDSVGSGNAVKAYCTCLLKK